MSLPQVNVTLTAVAAAGSSGDYDYGGAAGTAKWTGSTGAYLQERTERVERGDESSVVVSRTLIVSADLPFTVAQGDTLTFMTNGLTETVTARAVARRKIPGVSGTVRIALEDT